MSIRFGDKSVTLELTNVEIASIVSAFHSRLEHLSREIEKRIAAAGGDRSKAKVSGLEKNHTLVMEHFNRFVDILKVSANIEYERIKAQEAGNGHVHCEGLQGSGHESEA